jgi:hypothetical protein
MATGTLPFRGESSGVIFKAILDGNPTSAVRLNPDVPPKLEDVLNKALEKDRNLRYQVAAEMRSDLLRLKRDTQTGRGVAVGSGTVAVAQNAAPQSRTQQEVPTSGSVPALALPSSAAVKVAQRRTAGGGRLWQILVPTTALVVVLGGIFAWLSRPLPPPRVLKTTQITHDGAGKIGLLTDGSRLYITEDISAKQFLVQGSVAGGETSRIDTPFTNSVVSDISPDHSQLLVSDSVGTENESPAWVLPLPAGTPHRLGDIVAHWAVWSPNGTKSRLPRGRTFSWPTRLERTLEN